MFIKSGTHLSPLASKLAEASHKDRMRIPHIQATARGKGMKQDHMPAHLFVFLDTMNFLLMHPIS